ncbi:transglycosylase SLT domain-containing protein [Frateuria aurantia]|uniref:Soluble lytic murein transglycosylase-like protein n=1 Tax=Frateuria aurantia (strain ATCC 33424 / DSM 6220 / KCTC 2777 / LMG 1558 / NBRC 3245 / NCIMB 13370) TaxID=767434 RepID=H8KZG5_FRAAD|nr:transglycosylase SLT domain-containing protein [Frateuria aurantia]AFC86207.1 soluble lytic murein transglycosylase-like protein [Frateuria aurantia DSM 6220]
MMAALMSACASTAPSKGSAGGVNPLYTSLDDAARRYEQALQQAREGRGEQSNRTLQMALDQIKDGSARCSLTPGCDPQRFLSAYDRMLRLKDGSFFSSDDVDTYGDDQPDHAGTGSEVSPVSQAIPQIQRSVVLLRGQPLSQLIAMNGPVKAALEMWLTQWRPNLMDAWVNYQYLRHEMWPAYQHAGLPEALLFGFMAKESGGKVHAVSRSGAAGPLQFMYGTAMRLGLTGDGSFDLRFDPALAAKANADYINEQLEQFNNNLELAIGAYNGGEGRMQRIVGSDTSVSFYNPAVYSQMSQETREYVPAVLAAAWLFMHPDSYNLRFPHVNGTPGQVVLKRQASLTELTVCLGTALNHYDGWFRTLRNLNERVDPQAELPTGTTLVVPKALERAYGARCVEGPWPILAKDLHDATVPAAPTKVSTSPVNRRMIKHRVRRGETLTSIVNHHGCSSIKEVAELNHLHEQALAVGSTVQLPSCR